MPLNTQILRDGEEVQLRWGHFHVAAMTLASAWDSMEGKVAEVCPPPDDYNPTEEAIPLSPTDVFGLVGYHIIAETPLNNGCYTLKGPHTFLDPTDGEVLELLPGDVLSMWRD